MIWLNKFSPLAFIALTAAVLAIAFADHSYDDPYITFRYARNLAEGYGFVYNLGENVQSTTTPLYTLLLAGVGLIWPNFPLLSNIISAISLGLGAFFIYLIGKSFFQPAAGMTSAFLLLLFPQLIATFGAETCFYTMLVLGSFYFYARKALKIAVLFMALTSLTRADGVLVAIVISLHYILTQRRFPWKEALIYTGLIAPWYIFAWLNFGSPFPVTLMAKRHQAQMIISDSFLEGFIKMLRNYARTPLYRIYLPFFLMGLWQAIMRRRGWIPLISWTLSYFITYIALGVSRYFWYYAPLTPAMVVLSGIGLVDFVHFLEKYLRGYASALLVLILLLLVAPEIRSLLYLYQHPDPRLPIYREVGVWLDGHTPKEASVGTLEVGIIGYYARRRMVGFAGIVRPEVAKLLTHMTTYEDAAIWAVRTYMPDYVVIHPGWFPRLVESDWFIELYHPVKEFTHQDFHSNPLVLYSLNRGSKESVSSSPLSKSTLGRKPSFSLANPMSATRRDTPPL
jgi:hypothetical protein